MHGAGTCQVALSARDLRAQGCALLGWAASAYRNAAPVLRMQAPEGISIWRQADTETFIAPSP